MVAVWVSEIAGGHHGQYKQTHSVAGTGGRTTDTIGTMSAHRMRIDSKSHQIPENATI